MARCNWCSLIPTMAQESWKKEAEETGVHTDTPKAPVLCINNCGFFGSRMTENMCSKCYRDTIKARTMSTVVEKKSLVPLSSAPLEPEVTDGGYALVSDGKQVVEEDAPKPPSNRCFSFRKKVGLTGFECRCGDTFCSVHRYR
ncbi:hypothetical protein GUJ93_ZPchr0013g34089 [Zizania palustris]|uniref:A20-type domain-containing protein n=1 Tax=Zizania palustris TaxID=103762 RepID=A0A8J6BXQ4_ZIZPA|nr:hypothetical protein GUJ93_ZPchr0013g34089 [Zizania palustris]